MLLIIINLFIVPEKTFLNLDKSQFEHIRVVPIIVSIWFLVFSIPIFSYIQLSKPRKITKNKINKSIINLLIQKKKLTNLGRFLIARLLYADAIIAIQISFAVFIVKVLNLNTKEIFQLLLFTSIVQALGAYIGGIINDKIGSKKIIQISLLCVLFVIIGLVFFQSRLCCQLLLWATL